jgi:hypothetical protein
MGLCLRYPIRKEVSEEYYWGRWQAGTSTSMSDGETLLSMIVSDTTFFIFITQILQNLRMGFDPFVVLDTTCNLVNALLHSTTPTGI